MTAEQARCDGFSFVEAIVAILLVGIVAAVVFPRLLSSDAYNAAINRDQIVAFARSAQQKSIGRSDIRLTLQPSGNDLLLAVQDSTGEVQRATTPMRTVQLAGDVNVNASCGAAPGGNTITSGNAMQIEYDALGDLLQARFGNAAWQPVGTGVRICVNNNPMMSICISKTGFAYAGDCDD